MISRLITGAHVVCYINGKPIGTVTSFNYKSDTPRRPARGIDSPLPFELIQQATNIMGQVGLIRRIQDGGLEGGGIVTTLDDIFKEKYFSVNLIERVSDTVIFKADYCSVESQQWSIQPKAVMAGSFTFRAINWYNESINSSN